jgi:hypothetical protein
MSKSGAGNVTFGDNGNKLYSNVTCTFVKGSTALMEIC